MIDIYINYEHLKKEYGVNTNEEVEIELAKEMNILDDEFEAMKGFAPFSTEELKIAKKSWIEHDLKEVLTGDIEKDVEIIKEYNRLNNL